MSLLRFTSAWSWFRGLFGSWKPSFGVSADSNSCEHDYEDAWRWPELDMVTVSDDEDRLIFTINEMVLEICTECSRSKHPRKDVVKTFRVEASKLNEREVQGNRYYAR